MPDRRNLLKIRELIEKGEDATYGEQGSPQPIDLATIVERLSKRHQKPDDKTGQIRALKIKAGIESSKNTATPKFGDLKLEKTADERIKAIGKFYSAFRLPISKLAAFFSSLPAAAELHSNLKAADIRLKPDAYIALSTTVAVTAALASIFAILYVSALTLQDNNFLPAATLAVIVGMLVFFTVGIGSMLYPSVLAETRAQAIDRDLPFALRHLATQIKAGVSFQRALQSVSEGEYGLLSYEMKRLIRDMEAGKPAEDALNDLHDRTRSRGLRQTSMQIVRTLKSGGALAEIISSIASDVSFETKMKVRDFTEQLNLINVVFIMTAVVAPVVLTILVSVMQLPLLGGAVNQATVIGIFAADAVAMLTIMFFIKHIEPTA